MEIENMSTLDEGKVVEIKSAYCENDTDFITEVRAICEKKRSTNKSFFDESSISDKQCDEIAEYCRIHAAANTFNSNSMVPVAKLRQRPGVECCQCGCRKATGENLPLCMNEQNLTFLGPGVLLFFFYMKHVRLMVLLLLVGFSFYSIISSILSPTSISVDPCTGKTNQLQKIICQYNSISTFNLKTAQILRHFQLWTGLFFFLLWTLGVKFIQFLGEKKNQEIDNLLDSASDYTVRLENLPFGRVSQTELIEFVNELWTTREEITVENREQVINATKDELQLKSIQIIYNMSECRNLISKLQVLCLEIEQFIKETNTIPGEYSPLYKAKKLEILQTFQELKKIRKKFLEDPEYRRSLSTTCALIEFKSSDQQSEFLHLFENNSANFFATLCQRTHKITYLGEQIIFSRAPEPSDFNWSNCEIKFSYLRYVIIWFITMFILYSAYALVSYTQTMQLIRSSATAITSMIIQIFNRIIWISLSFLVLFEYQNTKTDAIISLMKKSIFAQVMNVVMAPMISKFLNNKPLYGEDSVSSASIEYQFIMFFMMFIFYVANPLYYWKLIVLSVKSLRNRMIRNLCQIVGEVDTIDQIRPVLSYYEGPDFPIAGGYVYMTTAIIHTMFYCHLQPILFLILTFNMTGFYFIMKYLLLRRCKIPDLTDYHIFECAISSVSYGTLLYCLGSLLFIVLETYEFEDRTLSPSQLIPSAICLVLWLVLNMNIFHISPKINEYLFESIPFNQDFVKASEVQQQQQEIKINDIFADMLMNSVENQKLLYQRKQSYYKHCNTHKLFNYEGELKEVPSAEMIQRAYEVQRFCQSFFKKCEEEDKAQKAGSDGGSGKKMMQDLAQRFLIPAVQLKKSEDEPISMNNTQMQLENTSPQSVMKSFISKFMKKVD